MYNILTYNIQCLYHLGDQFKKISCIPLQTSPAFQIMSFPCPTSLTSLKAIAASSTSIIHHYAQLPMSKVSVNGKTVPTRFEGPAHQHDLFSFHGLDFTGNIGGFENRVRCIIRPQPPESDRHQRNQRLLLYSSERSGSSGEGRRCAVDMTKRGTIKGKCGPVRRLNRLID
jgi:hypothetical protein